MNILKLYAVTFLSSLDSNSVVLDFRVEIEDTSVDK